MSEISRSKQKWISYKTISSFEVTRILRIWIQTLLPSAVTMTLYFVIFGSLIGSRIGEMGGFDYMAFIVPGLIMMAVITNSYSNVATSFFNVKFQKSIQEILVSPTPNWVIIAGYVTGGVFRGLFVGLIVTIISLFFTHLAVHNFLVIISSVLLTSILFSLAGLLNAVLAEGSSFDKIQIVPIFVLTPLTYLGGVFYSIKLLPEFWQSVSLANPILYMVNIFRYGFLGVSDIPLWSAYLIIFAFIFAFYFIILYFLNKGKGMRE